MANICSNIEKYLLKYARICRKIWPNLCPDMLKNGEISVQIWRKYGKISVQICSNLHKNMPRYGEICSAIWKQYFIRADSRRVE